MIVTFVSIQFTISNSYSPSIQSMWFNKCTCICLVVNCNQPLYTHTEITIKNLTLYSNKQTNTDVTVDEVYN